MKHNVAKKQVRQLEYTNKIKRLSSRIRSNYKKELVHLILNGREKGIHCNLIWLI